MRVLLCNKFHYRRAGTCVYMFGLADLLRAQGHQVHFFSMHHPLNLPCEDERFFADYIDFADLNQAKSVTNGFRVVTRSIYSRHARQRLRALLDHVRPDIAHLQNIHNHLTPSILNEFRARGIPVVWTLHDYKLICPDATLLSNGVHCEACRGGRYYQCALRRCKKGSLLASGVAMVEAYTHAGMDLPGKVACFLSPSRFLREKFISFGWDPEKVRFLRNFLPVFPRPSYSGAGYGLYLGSLHPVKGVRTLLQALRKAPHAPFRILGTGSDEAWLKERARAWGMHHVTFLGHQSGPALEETVRGADYGVVPSAVHENCPYAVMELMAEGKPVVASRMGGIPELVDDGRTGLLFEAGDDAALAAHITRLSTDGALRDAMGRAARAHAEEAFSAGPHYEQLLEVYQAALGA